MEKLKRFIDCYIPTETCNFRCHYCYIAQKRKFNNKLFKLTQEPEFIGKALSVKRMGGHCLINLCAGGETLLSNQIIDLIRILLEEGHYVMVVTNGSLKNRFEQIAKYPEELLNHLLFKFSFHYLELQRLGLLDTFADNVNLMKKSGASINVEITPSDELEPYIDEIKEYSIKKFGALPHITIGRKDIDDIPPLTDRTFEDYKKIWGQFESTMFSFKSTIFGVKRNEFCYAGDWSVYLNVETGEMKQCYCGRKICNIYENLEEPIKFCPIGNKCSLPHCYNGHSFLTLGDIPEMDSPTYSEIRNRKCDDGSMWLTKDMDKFISQKLCENNQVLSRKEQQKINMKNSIKDGPQQIKSVIKKVIKRK